MSSDATTINNACYVLDGMHNDPPTKCWVRLLCRGVVFQINALADDLKDTSLLQQWQTLLKDLYAPGMTIQDRIDRWDQLCNVLIGTSLPVLEDLAPEAPRDRSLWACFHTPTYHLQLIQDPASGAVHASVASGPVDGSPSGCQVAKIGDLDAFAPGLTHYSSRDVEIIERGGDPSFPPARVTTPDGAIHGFKACVQDSKRLGTDHVSDHHWDAICAYLQLHKDPLGVPGIPSVSGIVVEEEGGFAGVLLQDIRATGNLADCLSNNNITTVERLQRARQLAPKWEGRVSSIVARLHGRGYCLYEEISQCGIDESILCVDEDDEIWLPLSGIFLMDRESDEFRKRVRRDEEDVRKVFDRFLPEELEKRAAEMGDR
jgi:hypothetical protein